jgi:Electron transfer DM13
LKLNRRGTAILAAIALIVAAPTWYLASPLFIMTRGAEAPPTGFSIVVATGVFVSGEPGHHAEGQLTLLSDGTSYVFHFANFAVTNGPDIDVFLAHGPRVAAGDVNLGDVKATQGSSNYAVPTGVDPRDFAYVVIWCVPFSVQFGYAVLSFA